MSKQIQKIKIKLPVKNSTLDPEINHSTTDDFYKRLSFSIDVKEKQIQEKMELKFKINDLIDENLKLKTKIAHQDKEL